jgi:type I restriction enzyme S subunit
MNPTQLIAYFDHISDAPYAIPRLRRFILDLAVRGKLVEQDSNDEPAAELLKRIQAEKSRLEREGKINKQDMASPVLENDEPFAIPTNWAWTRLGQIGDWRSGSTPSRGNYEYYGGGITWLKSGELNDNQQLAGSEETVTELAMSKCSFRRNQPGDVLMAMYGATIGKLAILAEPAVTNQAVCGCTPFTGVFNRYLFNFLRSQRAEFNFVSEGGAQPNISKVKVVGSTFPLPPLAEQHRIVAKIDELMGLCDRMEAARAEMENRRHRLAIASLYYLSNGADRKALREQAAFYLGELPRLTKNNEQVELLRQTIINLGIQGKLVPQDQSDEPASELLKRIEKEKARLVKDGKIRYGRPAIPARRDELAFDLRPGWEAARISQILVELQTGPFGSSLHQSDYQKGGTPVINPASIQNERLVPIEAMAVGSATLERLATFKLRERDIVMGRRGEMGRCAVVNEQEAGWLCGTGSLILRLPECVFPRFFVTLIGSPLVREYLGGSAVGATMQNLNQSILLNLVIGLPPLGEQQRIVAKVDELMAVCDRLENQLTTARTLSCRLLETVLGDALNGGETQFDKPRAARG